MINVNTDDVVTLDVETFYDTANKYDLRHMTTEAYVRDPRFLFHGVGIKRNDKPTRKVNGHDNTIAVLRKLPLDQMTVVAHNAPFDGLTLSQVCGVRPKAYIDTAAMARLIYGNTLASYSLKALTQQFLPGLVKDQTALFNVDGKRELDDEEQEGLMEYCAMDCDLTYALYKYFLPQLQDSPMNVGVIDLITRMFSDPALTLDEPVLSKLIADEAVAKEHALANCVATDMSQLRSNPKMATLLRSLGVEPPMKISPANGKETYAFAKSDREFEALLRHENQDVADLVAARLRCKTSINETRAKSYLAVAERGAWPVDLEVSGARTTHRLSGRSGGGGNPQNLGKKSPLRLAITPPAGFALLACDSANIELRGALSIANETEVIKAIREGQDLYRVFAAVIYDKTVDDVTDSERAVGKVAMLSLQYGSGAAKFHHTAWTWGLSIDEYEAARIVCLYRDTFSGITRTWKVCDRIIQMLVRGEAEGTWFDHLVHPVVDGPMGHPALKLVETGTYITYPNLRREFCEERSRMRFMYDVTDKKSRRIVPADLYGAKMFEHIIQALARNVVLEQTLNADEFLLKEISYQCRTVMSVHDESVHLIPDSCDLSAAKQGVLDVYGTSPDWWPELPVAGEAAYGANYGEAK